MNTDDQFALRFTGYRLLRKTYKEVAAIMAEFDQDEALLRQALKLGHGVEIDDATAGGTVLHIVIDQQQTEKLKEYRIPNPTLLQLIGSSRVISISEKDAIERFEKIIKGDE